MKTLIILRHADALEKTSGMSDFERPLSDEGCSQASRQGQFLRQAGICIDRVVASSALRARTTAETVVDASGAGVDIETSDELYNAPGETLLEYVRCLPDELTRLLMVAHLPGVAQLLSLLTTEHVDLDHIFSPATLAAVQLDGDSWHEFDYGVGALTLFLPPVLSPA
ncbi:MAG: phosphohistidine phosphatase SixA [SAR324 cluster bacterium]|nr:phosphohistidine phosphatase SixA [SAR324 cluster bacterium]MCZ6842291.1 phosphohistidine phosphatase SixA [SAR324 cluster bacterium]